MSIKIGGILDGAAGPQTQQYVAPNPSAGFGSITIYNSSSSSLNIWLGQNSVLGTPDIAVPAQVVLTYPIPGVDRLTCSFAVFPCTGSCTISIVDTVLVAASSLLPGSVGSAGIPPAAFPAPTGLQGMLYGVGNAAGLLSNNGAASSFLIVPAPLVAGTSTYVYSLVVNVVVSATDAVGNATLAYLKLCSTNTGGFTFQQYTTGLGYAFPNPPLTGYDWGHLEIAYSGGPLPLFYTNTAIYGFFADNKGLVGGSELDGSVMVSYAQF